MVNDERYNYSYSGGLLLEEVKQQWIDYLSDWQNDEKFIYHYNSDNKISKIENGSWSQSRQECSLSKQTLHEYNAAGLKSQQNEQIKHAGVWKDTRIQTFDYDANDNLTELIIQDCNFIRGTCENTARHSYTYSPFNKEECYILELWNGTSAEWKNYQKKTTFLVLAINLSFCIINRKKHY